MNESDLFSHSRRMSLFWLSAICFAMLVSCSSTSLTSVWIDAAHQGRPIRSILVIGIMNPGEMRDVVEDDLVRQFERRGVKAIAGHKLFSYETMPDEQELAKKVSEVGTEAVLISRLVEIKDVESYATYPPYVSADLFGYYAYCCQNVISSGYGVKFETTVFDAASSKVIWAALSDTELERKRETITESYSEAIVRSIYEMKLIR